MRWRKPKAHPHGHIEGAKLTLPGPKGHLVAFPIQARMVRVKVGKVVNTRHWAYDLAGTERMAIACTVTGKDGVVESFYLDNDDLTTLWKVTLGNGHPNLGLRQLPVEREVYDQNIRTFYRVEHISKAANGDPDDKDKYRVITGV